ncbi:hypothetical protein Ga0609869_002843 [Rhodovulum iodosum]|uniref:Uncharacterized protein n=1 Tax=Rhodovulum iodosum TaxID=68291 RepID=A0ABV3XXL2_9RHOB
MSRLCRYRIWVGTPASQDRDAPTHAARNGAVKLEDHP